MPAQVLTLYLRTSSMTQISRLQDELVCAGGIHPLGQILAASSPGLKWYAANSLKHCAAASPQGREAVERSGVIAILVKQLAHDKWWTPGRRQVQAWGFPSPRQQLLFELRLPGHSVANWEFATTRQTSNWRNLS